MATRKKRGPKGPRPLPENIEEVLEALPSAEEDDDLYEGMTERQEMIARFKLRGLSQSAIAKFLGVSQPIISKEMKRIRKHLAEKGRGIDQHYLIGETATVYEDVMAKAYQIYSEASGEGDRNAQVKSLQLVMSAREKHTKLLMDLGILKRASTNSEVKVTLSPLIESWDEKKKEQVAHAVVETTLEPLPPPAPPEDDEPIDAEWEDDDD